jgi:uncharacterized protein
MRELRRKDRKSTQEETTELLTRGEYGILSTVDKDGQPYGVPLSYVYRNEAIYIHSDLKGHKLDNIAANPKVSFSVVGNVQLLAQQFTTNYESVVAFGTATEISGNEKNDALFGLIEKYSPEFLEEGKKYIQSDNKITQVIKISIDHISGKARR